MSKPIVSVTTPSGPIVDPGTGQPTFAFMKWLQGIGTTVNKAFDTQASLTPGSMPTPTASTIGGILAAGPVAHEWIREIDDTGTPHLSQPGFGDLSGTAVPAQIPALSALSGAVTPGQVPALSALGGSVTPAQVPALSALSGSVTPAQVPALSALSGQITAAQLPAAGINATITTAPLTVGGTQGSMTFTNGILTAQVQAT